MHVLVRKAIERRLEELGRQGLGDRLVQHAREQHSRRLPFYDNYHLALVGDPNRVPPVEGYLVKIGYRAHEEDLAAAPTPPTAPQPAAAAPVDGGTLVCSECGATFPAGTRFCPQHGPTLVAAAGGALICRECGRRFDAGTRFCPQHGPTLEPESAAPAEAPSAAPSPSTGSVEDRLTRLKQLWESGLITEEEYNTRKSAILQEV
jgi:RNA polymerase subunit RPABC4/transcription elongation factor Spt4